MENWIYLPEVPDTLREVLDDPLKEAFLVYGHSAGGAGVILEVRAENGAEAIDAARALRPDCRFNHTNVK